MYKDWSTIQEKYDAIKDHKPRASKKLNELGDILTSAYFLNPKEADLMWQYIIDLNIADNITYSKFYIAQVFNKLTDRMSAKDATAFVNMNTERMRLMINYGYDGGSLWHCLNVMINGFIDAENFDDAFLVIGYFWDKFGGIDSNNHEVFVVAENVAKLCMERIRTGNKSDLAEKLLEAIENTDNEDVNNLVDLIKVVNSEEDLVECDRLFRIAIKLKRPVEFFDLLWRARNNYTQEELKDWWLEYDANCESDEIRPWNYMYEDQEEYKDSKLKFYVDLEKDADNLLDFYFGRTTLYTVEKGVIWSWIEERDWERFTKYVSMVVANTPDEHFECSDIRRVLETYMNSCFDSYFDTLYQGRSYNELMASNKTEFADALAKVSVLTMGCEAHESYHEFAKSFIHKLEGNLDVLNKYGFEDIEDTRSAEEKLKSYVKDFLHSGQIEHKGGTKYAIIMNELRDERFGQSDNTSNIITIDVTNFVKDMIVKKYDIDSDVIKKENEDEEKKVDHELESDYRLAMDDDIAEFYFMHCPREYMKRKELISACLKKNNLNRAIELVDMIAKTQDNDGYDTPNGWGRQNMLTMYYLIDQFAYDKADSWQGEGITDEMRENVKQLVYRIKSYLPIKSQEELNEKIYRIDPEKDDIEEYINQLLEDAKLYTTYPKPRGKAGAPDINRMSREFMDCFERLSRMNRLDVIVEIMRIFSQVSSVLRPVTYDRWFVFMMRGVKAGDMLKIFKLDKDIFEIWLESKELKDYDIIEVAENIAKDCSRQDFQEFRNMVISKRGNIEGINACFKGNSENTETQIVFDGEKVKILLDYVDFFGNNPIGEMNLHLLTISKSEDVDSVRLSKCEINGINTTECGFLHSLEGNPEIGYELFDCYKTSKDELTVWTDFFERNDIKEVSSIILKFVVVDDSLKILEKSGELLIELDYDTGVYKVKQQAMSM